MLRPRTLAELHAIAPAIVPVRRSGIVREVAPGVYKLSGDAFQALPGLSLHQLVDIADPDGSLHNLLGCHAGPAPAADMPDLR